MDGRQPISECLPLAKSMAEIRLKMWTTPLSSPQRLKIVARARIEAENCRDACIKSFLSGRNVYYGESQYKSIQDIDLHYIKRLKILDGYERVALEPSFAEVAGASIDDHESKITDLAASWQDKYISDRHTVRDHVGHDRARLEKIFIQKPDDFMVSSFTDKEIAEWAIAATMAFYQHLIDSWITSTSKDWWDFNVLRLPNDFDLGRTVGSVLVVSDDESMEASRVQIVLVRDSNAPKGFYIKTAHPINKPMKV